MLSLSAMNHQTQDLSRGLRGGLSFVHPVTGFHVDSVHSIADFAMLVQRLRAVGGGAP